MNNDYFEVNNEYKCFKSNKKKYLEDIFIEKLNHKLFNTAVIVNEDKVHNNDFRIKFINNYKPIFKKIKRINLTRNILNTSKPELLGKIIKKAVATLAEKIKLFKAPKKIIPTFDFVELREGMIERDVENELVSHITNFLLEMGNGFAYIGHQKLLKFRFVGVKT